ncbi:MAG: peroxiredoxin [Methyloceanibacter sp.]|uniref:peroxiredoxin n=1 Tax=Methyloceanibacter sp. TaxID=1965321 RepID=UPI003D9B0FA6
MSRAGRAARHAITEAAAIADLTSLPDDLPSPIADGACDHLSGIRMPPLSLASTAGRDVDLGMPHDHRLLPEDRRPGESLPDSWDAIPGARGCTPQACAFRDHYRELAELGARVFGLSTQPTDYQREFVQRLHLPFELLSDADLRLATVLGLPTFESGGMRLIKLTLVVNESAIEHVFYPVFPPNESARVVVMWLRGLSGGGAA